MKHSKTDLKTRTVRTSNFVLLSFWLLCSNALWAQQSSLVNYDYPYSANAYSADNINGINGSINWDNFSDFNLPADYTFAWFPVFAHYGDYSVPLRKGFNLTTTYDNQVAYEYSIGGSLAPWETPVEPRLGVYNDITKTCVYSWEVLDQGTYDEVKNKYQLRFNQNVRLNYNPSSNSCEQPSSAPPFLPTNNVQNYGTSFYNNGSSIEQNVGYTMIDFEQIYGLERVYGATGIDGFLACVKDYNCASTHPTMGGYDFFGALTQRIGMPAGIDQLPFEEFKRAWYRMQIQTYYAPFDAFHSIISSSKPRISNYSSNLESVDKMDEAKQNNVPWTTVISDPTYLSYLYKDTTQFQNFGNHLVDAMDDITPDVYSAWYGRYGDWSIESGKYLTKLIEQVEFNKAWASTLDKPMIPYLWLKRDGFRSDDPLTTADDSEVNEDYTMFASPACAESQAIFSIMSGADGVMLWDGEWDYWTNQHVYEYFIKGMHRLSSFNHFLADPAREYVYEDDPFELEAKEENVIQNNQHFAIWRGITSGDSILVAAQNPYAPNETYQTTAIINYQNWSDTITLVGREIFLGTARWNVTDTSSASVVDFAKDFTLNIYPNPTRDQISITSESGTIDHVEITDVSGKIILQQKAHHESLEIDCSPFTKGLYFIHVWNNFGQQITQQIIVQ